MRLSWPFRRRVTIPPFDLRSRRWERRAVERQILGDGRVRLVFDCGHERLLSVGLLGGMPFDELPAFRCLDCLQSAEAEARAIQAARAR